MRPFRFRAQAALDVRRKAHDQALLLQARAQRELAAADRDVLDATAAVDKADARLGDALRLSLDHAQLVWHHAWRHRCVAERARLELRRAEHDTAVQRATAHVMETYKQVRSLERLREHALRAWQKTADYEERKTMDALAASRFVQEKNDCDDHFRHQ